MAIFNMHHPRAAVERVGKVAKKRRRTRHPGHLSSALSTRGAITKILDRNNSDLHQAVISVEDVLTPPRLKYRRNSPLEYNKPSTRTTIG